MDKLVVKIPGGVVKMNLNRKGVPMSPKLHEPPKKSGLSDERKSRLMRFTNGFENKSKIDTLKMSREIRGKE